jgi:2-polyprenyl-3-methyl-5-hydroxy-6-metoxy-1,4-benzoquinol methylase
MTTTRPHYDNVPGNLYDKYNTRNPIARRMVANFIGSFLELADKTGARNAFEAGCGEGMLSLELLRRGWDVRGTDLDASVVGMANASAAAEGFDKRFDVKDIYDLDSKDGAELVVCCEVMEHLPEPERALEVLVGLARPWLLLSVPREPLWRALNMARGKYLSRLGNTPGHIQHWSRRRFVAMVSERAEVVEVRSPLPWTMLLCRVR